MSDGTSIPQALVHRARALGPAVLELVVEAFQQAREIERVRSLQQAIETCEREGLSRAERFVDLSDEDMAAFEARFGAMPPSPVVAAFYEGIAEGVEACCARLRALDNAAPSAH
ncbi:MAG: hypothetical protein AB8I08_10255 [Sandaracinaceae bacterium]